MLYVLTEAEYAALVPRRQRDDAIRVATEKTGLLDCLHAAIEHVPLSAEQRMAIWENYQAGRAAMAARVGMDDGK